ncbi:MAG: hypothetical protein R3F65_10985 [bacterium]
MMRRVMAWRASESVAVLAAVLAAGLAAGLWGCDDEAEAVDGGPAVEAGPPDSGVAADEGLADEGAPLPEGTAGCDGLQDEVCAWPWPSNVYLEPDPARVTGYTLRFGAASLPASTLAGPVDPAPFTRMDGYGLGTPIMAWFPGVDPALLPDETAIEASLASDAAALLFAVGEAGLVRVPYFVDLDAKARAGEPKAVIMRPAVILEPDTRYIVAFRGLRTAEGAAIEPSAAFAALRDGRTRGHALLGPRQARFDEVFALLAGAGVARETLTLAWDFHTASSDALTGRLRHMVADALRVVGEDGPELVVDVVDAYSPEPDDPMGRTYNPYIAYRIKGHFRAPHYMKVAEPWMGKQGWVFNLGADGMPTQDGWREDVQFYATIPHSALDGTPHGLINHGHGMFGDAKDAADLGWTRLCGKYPPRECGWFHGRVDQNHGFITYAVDLVGMSQFDRDEYAVEVLTDLSRFTWLTDRLHQGLVEYVLITRAMQRRFAALPEVAALGVQVNAAESYYWGISQGAIFGPTFVAVSPDVARGALGVAGANYSTLLERSRNFEQFFGLLAAVYLDRRDQLSLIALMQLLWDGTDGVSYYRHLSLDPFDGQENQVLVDVARGDYQVSPLTMETVARSGLGLAVMANYDDEREVPLVSAQAYPHVGSGLVNWHFGNAWPAPGNLPPAEDGVNGDPHESARHLDAMVAQMAHFFRTGEIIDVCEGGVCPVVPAGE